MRIVLSGIFWISLILLEWSYFGYPMLMWAWSKLAGKPIRKDHTHLPMITLLIPAYNEADVIGRKLHNSVALDYPHDRLEIIVVDDGSTDRTAAIVRDFPQVRLIQQTQRGGKPAGLNRGFREARGEIVVLSDASPDYEFNALRQLVRAFADPQVGVVVGDLLLWDAESAVVKPAGLYWRYEAAIRRWESKIGSTVAVHGNMFAIRRDLYRPLPLDQVNDEFSIAMNVIAQGYRVVYEPEAVSYDDASATMRDEFQRRARINAGRYQALFNTGYLLKLDSQTRFQLFSHKLLRAVTPVLMILTLITNLILFLSAPIRWIVPLIGQIGFYAAAAFGWQRRSQGAKLPKYLNVPFFFVSSNLAALVGLWRWITGKQRPTWQKRAAQTIDSEVETEATLSQ
ncbi:MAG: glycosyltransferase family 2 protein [Anaerolineae bacterium]|nr:glycosyltransferase family 2 protein [Anaerolineae bacterium]